MVIKLEGRGGVCWPLVEELFFAASLSGFNIAHLFFYYFPYVLILQTFTSCLCLKLSSLRKKKEFDIVTHELFNFLTNVKDIHTIHTDLISNCLKNLIFGKFDSCARIRIGGERVAALRGGKLQKGGASQHEPGTQTKQILHSGRGKYLLSKGQNVEGGGSLGVKKGWASEDKEREGLEWRKGRKTGEKGK